MNIAIRPTTPQDDAFLFDLFCSVHSDEFAPFGLESSALESFMGMQFDAQRQYYYNQFTDADDSIITLEGESIGRLIVAKGSEEFRLVEIALLHDYRNRGIGSLLIQKLIAEAARAKKPVTLHVAKTNRAFHLYFRLGFDKVSETNTHYFMRYEA